MKDFISIIITNYNGKKWLKECFDSIKNQSHKNFEVIFVDNNSVDDSLEFVKKKYAWIKVVKNSFNAGFAEGNNVGLKYATGDYIFLLNNDAYFKDQNHLRKMLQGFKSIANAGSIQSKIIRTGEMDTLDTCGSYWTDTSVLYHYGCRQNQGNKKFNKPMPIFSNKGASMMIKKEVIDKIGFFDKDFWSYYEDTDLCNRIWLSGYECWYYPKATTYHAVGETSSLFDDSFIQFHNFKNKLMSFLKNFEIRVLIKILPIYFVLSVSLSLFWLLKGKWKHFLSIYKSFWWNITHIKETLNKRKVIQSFREKKDAEIFRKVKRNPHIRYYYHLLSDLKNYED